MGKVYRVDIGEFRTPTLTKEGYLKADGLATRKGIFEYVMMDGSIRKELKDPNEVFNRQAMDSLSEVPITNDHPPVMLDSSNVRGYSVGFTGKEVTNDGHFVKVGLTIMDAATVNNMLIDGKVELSAGYHVDLDETPGVFEGQSYDAVQRNIQYNHLAIVDRGRAGHEARVRLHGQDSGCMIAARATNDDTVTETGDEPMKATKIKLDGIEYEVSETVAPIVQKKVDALGAAEKSRDELQGRCDALKAEVSEAKKALEDAEAKQPDMEVMRSQVKARLDLEVVAKEFLDDDEEDTNLDGLSDADLKRKVIATAYPKTDLSEKNDDYINGSFALLMESKKPADKAADPVKKQLEKEPHDKKRVDGETARVTAMAKAQDQWKTGSKAQAKSN